MNKQINFASMGIVVLCLMAGVILPGCISGRSDVRYGPKGPAVTGKTLKHVRCGQTSKEWVLGTLGAPTAATATPEGTEVLKYEYTKKTDVDFDFCPFLDFDDKKEERTTVYFEIRDGVVLKYWRD